MARAFATESEIILFDDPTRGVDIGTKRELYEKIRAAAGSGCCFLWYTTENDELFLCDRVFVFHERKVVDIIDPGRIWTKERLLRASFVRGLTTWAAAGMSLRLRAVVASGNWPNALGMPPLALALIALVLILAIVFWLRPNVASYNGLRLLLNLSPVLVFTALAQMFIMTAGDIDLGIGLNPAWSLPDCARRG